MSNGSNAFDWREFITLADALAAEKSAKESAYRSAVSRAYYGAYCLARNEIRENNWAELAGNGNDHRVVSDYFSKNGDKAKAKIGQDLNRLRQDRNKADYDDVCPSLSKLARKSLKRARSIVSLLKSITIENETQADSK